MRRLYLFPTSPFSRRARLALAHKHLAYEPVDARADPAQLAAARALVPVKTLPVLVEPDGRALGDSTAITHYLDRAYPQAPALWPATRDEARAAFETAALVDVVLNTIVDTGNRFYALHTAPAWPTVRAEMTERIQRAMDSLATRAAELGGGTVLASGWSAADIYLYTMVAWLTGLPARAANYPLAAQLLTLGWSVPDPLVRFAQAHRDRADVRGLDEAIHTPSNQ